MAATADRDRAGRGLRLRHAGARRPGGDAASGPGRRGGDAAGGDADRAPGQRLGREHGDHWGLRQLLPQAGSHRPGRVGRQRA